MTQSTIKLALVGLLTAVSAHAVCPTGTVLRSQLDGKNVCALSQKKYLGTMLNLTAENDYLIETGTYIGADNSQSSVLRIQPGVKIMANPGTFLVIMRGSKIFAEGTVAKPIVFTAAKSSARKRGEWGGLVINGNAPINACKAGTPVCEAISEGIKEEQVKFGGNVPSDSSGTLRYVRVEFGGFPIAPDNELNGITFNGVGNGTLVDYIQVHMNADDGVEFFGGTVDARHLVLTSNDDDSMDWDMGWTGRVQYALIRHANDVADTGFEADNLKSPMNAQPRSNPIISNVTMLGGAKSGVAMMLKRGTSAQIHNLAVSGFSKGCLDIDDAETFNHGGIKVTHSVFACDVMAQKDADDIWSVEEWLKMQPENIQVSSLGLAGYIPTENSPLLGRGMTLEDPFFEPVDFVGAIGSKEDDWTQGWTTWVTE